MPTFLRAPSGAQIALIKAVVFLICLLPALNLALGWYEDALGANPIETITRASGEWTLRFLLITLAVTPLRRYTGMHWLLRLRRMLGLFAFAYGAAHLTTYLWLDQFFDWQAIANDILERPFITVGFAAFVLLIPLAATSNSFAIRKLGGRRWQSLHRSSYAIAILGVVHFWWLVKADLLEPLVYALILAVLLGLRAWWRELERRRQLSVPPPAKHLERPVIRIVPK
ncbi:Protein-methionine-sulfoxide reductase heme-binding subunit MsrQ [Thauera humireducens]|uniref:sulfite oxidase heme-binding subunit YedZ n=1 Tax=Thauera TaxID=33057 RepID=UPI0002CDB003|nr:MULTISPECIES: protein-methionine-sulfoxide reductase heme-binding subunit MsrQ [Thauera]ENO75249.1 ferric reductase domain-containing transmembrane protein [Thauera sp. 63]CAH1747577.1 Protein-methionine-sulfoxide reductase heme-binding subunit MsrQ [Thauera humireducens]